MESLEDIQLPVLFKHFKISGVLNFFDFITHSSLERVLSL